PVAIESTIEPREDLVGFVDDREIELAAREQHRRPRFAPGELAPDQDDPGPLHATVTRPFTRLDPEQRPQLLPPLSQQRFGRDQQDAAGPLGPQLRDDETRFDRLPEPDFIREDAPPLGDPAQREHHGVDLMWVGIHSARALRGEVAPLLARSPQTNEIFGVPPPRQGMRCSHPDRTSWHNRSRAGTPMGRSVVESSAPYDSRAIG